MEASLTDLLAAAGVFAASALLGTVKKYTGMLDGKIGGALKPLQPALVMAAGIGLPYITDALSIAPVDPSVFITAPTATIAAVTFREGAKRLKR